MKSYTDIEQSKKLAEILPMESADMEYLAIKENSKLVGGVPFVKDDSEVENSAYSHTYDRIACWSLAALLEYMNRNFYNISLNYCGSEYTISFDDSENYKTITKDYSIDAVFEMVIWLKENNRL